MTIEDAIRVLKKDRDLCLFNPMTGECEPMNEDCRQSAEAYDVILSELDKQRKEERTPTECLFIDSGWLGELSCSACRETIGTRADTQRMKFCPYCGRHRKHAPAEETEENPEDWNAQIHD